MHGCLNTLRKGAIGVGVGFFLVWGSAKGQIAAGKEKFLGNIIGNAYQIPTHFMTYWNQVTPENAGKWGSVESSRNQMNWASLDRIYRFAKDNGLPFKQHNFVWGQQQPGWIGSLSREDQRKEVEEWIRLFGARYPGTDMIDVVNEPIHAPPPYKEALGGDGTTGWDWVIWAFEKARAYCPGAQLILNEYNVLHSFTNLNKMIQIATLLKERGLIDAIGIQGHYFELQYYAPSALKNGLDRLSKTGLPIYISEFEINEANDQAQLTGYQRYFPIFWQHPAVRGITLWGYEEGKMWQPNGYLIRTDGSERPAMEWLWTYVQGTVVRRCTEIIPSDYVLFPNYPNPFNPSTEIPFQLARPAWVRLTIVDMVGREVICLDEGERPAGRHVRSWNGQDASGREVPSGGYLYRLQVADERGPFSETRKMLFIR